MIPLELKPGDKIRIREGVRDWAGKEGVFVSAIFQVKFPGIGVRLFNGRQVELLAINEELERLREVNAELLEAANELLQANMGWIDCMLGVDKEDWEKATDAVRAAILKAEKGSAHQNL